MPGSNKGPGEDILVFISRKMSFLAKILCLSSV